MGFQNGDYLQANWNDGTDFGFAKLADGGQHIESYEFADGSVLSQIDLGAYHLSLIHI